MILDLRYKDFNDKSRLRKLVSDLDESAKFILEYAPTDLNLRSLRQMHVRIFNFPADYGATELYMRHRQRDYVCLDAKLLKNHYWAALQYIIHGISHSFCHLNDNVLEEAFCEWISYSVIRKLARLKGVRFSRYISNSIKSLSSTAYRNYYSIARKIEKKRSFRLLEMNALARRGRLAKKRQEGVVKKIHNRTIKHEDLELDIIPELERGFKQVR